MHRLLALLLALLPLFGLDASRSTFVHHQRSDGIDLLHARATLRAGVAWLDCIATATGACHWTLQPTRCAAGDAAARPGRCGPGTLRHVSLAPDSRHRLAGVASLRVCVGRSAGLRDGACTTLGPRPR